MVKEFGLLKVELTKDPKEAKKETLKSWKKFKKIKLQTSLSYISLSP